MKDLKEIKQDLLEIRHYYSHIRDNCAGEKVGVKTSVEELTEKYSSVIKNAPIVLYELYCALYIEGNTMESLADKWCYSFSTIYKRNRKLVKFLQENMN